MAEYGLDVTSKGHTDYVATEDPTVTNNFATVAFRFAHPMIQGERCCYAAVSEMPIMTPGSGWA
jgi:hypothetical protein